MKAGSHPWLHLSSDAGVEGCGVIAQGPGVVVRCLGLPIPIDDVLKQS